MAKSWLQKYGTYEEEVVASAVGITAFATGGQGSATQLLKKFNQIDTVASANDSVKLVPALIGKVQGIFNNSANDLSVFPATGEYIDGTINKEFIISPGDYIEFRSYASGKWDAANGIPVGAGTVTSASIVSANGFAGSVATASTTPAITISTTVTGILKGNGTAISAATAGTDYSLGTAALATGIIKSTTTTGALTIAVAGDFPTLNQNTTGNAATATLATASSTLTITNDNTTNAVMYPMWTTATTGNLSAKVSSLFNWNPSKIALVIGASVGELDEPGVAVPSTLELINNNGNQQLFTMKTYGASPGTQNDMHFYRYGGSPGLPSATTSGMSLFSMGCRGYGSSALTQSAAAFIIDASNTWTNTSTGASIRFETTPIGSTSRKQVLRIDNTGSLIVGIATTLINSEILSIQQDQNAATIGWIKNATNGTAAQTIFGVINNASLSMSMRIMSSSYTTDGAFIPGAALLDVSNSVGLNIVCEGASSTFNVYTGGYAAGNLRWTIQAAGNLITPTDNTVDIGASGATRPRTGYFGTSISTPQLIASNKTINTTSGDSATINAMAGRFRKDNTGTTFTLTNSFITASSVIKLQVVTLGLTTGGFPVPVAGAGSAIITFQNNDGSAVAPNIDADVNFFVIN